MSDRATIQELDVQHCEVLAAHIPETFLAPFREDKRSFVAMYSNEMGQEAAVTLFQAGIDELKAELGAA